MKFTTGLAVLVASLVVTSSCADDLQCGVGTRRSGGVCVLQCAPGERLDAETQTCLGVCSDGTIYNEDTGMCEPETSCGPGTHRVGSQCVPDTSIECGSGTSYDIETGRCVPDCVEGTHRDEETGACMPNSATCITGQVWDANTSQCVDVAGYCGEGTTWVASERACIPDDDLLDADYVEGTSENDPSFGGESAYERVELPEIGMVVVVGGSIDAAEDKDDDGDLDPDYDFFVFNIDRPTLLRISADGVGGASSGFLVQTLGEEPEFKRYGIGTTSDGTIRDVFLPSPGEYALVASDAMNFVSNPPGPFFGGDNLGYFITIEHLPVPNPDPLALETDVLETNGVWPLIPPERGSMLGFYSIDVTLDHESLGTLLTIDLVTEDHAVGPVLVILDGEDELITSSNESSEIRVFDREQSLTLVADYLYWFGGSDAQHTLTIEDLEMGSIFVDLDVTSISQPAWVPDDGRFPKAYFGFMATAGTVMTVHATTTTGETAFEITDSIFEKSYGWFQGRNVSPQYEGDIRFYCNEDGLYVLTVLDMSGAVGGLSSPDLIEFSWFNITSTVRSQAPIELGSVSELWTTEEPAEVSSDEWERFFIIEPPAGQSFLFDVTPVESLSPTLTFYSIEKEGPLTAQTQRTHLGEPFPRRFPGSLPVLFGVADAGFTAGSFDLTVMPLEVTQLGTLDASVPLDMNELPISPELSTNIFQVDPTAPGMVALAATPADDDDLLVIARDSFLEEIRRVDVGAVGMVERLEFLVSGSEPAFFDVVIVSGEEYPTSFVDLGLELEAFIVEEEPNDDPLDAHELSMQETVFGLLNTESDRDWYSITVSGAATLVAETMGTGGATAVDTRLLLLDEDWTVQLGVDEDGGDGTYSRLTSPLPDAGTYYIVVEAGTSDALGQYFLAVDATLR